MAYRAAALLVVAAAFLGIGAGGCGSDAPSVDVPTSTDPVTGASATDDTALLREIEIETLAGVERVTFAFENGVPGYEVGYVERPVVADGSGAAVAVKGDAVLRVRMEPALDADLTQEDAPATYTGPTRFEPDTETIAELVRIGGFEAVLTWAIGIDEKAPFAVSTLADPPRLVIDIRSG